MASTDKLDHLLRALVDQFRDKNPSLNVDVVVTPMQKNDSKSIVDQIKSAGGNVSKVSRKEVRAQLPAGKVLALAGQNAISKIRIQRKPRMHSGRTF